MEGHQHDLVIVLREIIQIGVKGDLLQKAGKAGLLGLLHVLQDGGLELADVLQPAAAFHIVFGLQGSYIAALVQHLLQRFDEGDLIHRFGNAVHHGGKLHQGTGFTGKRGIFLGRLQGAVQRLSQAFRHLLGGIHGGLANAPFGLIDDAAEPQAVIGVIQHRQIGQNILDLLAVEELEAADDAVRDPLPDEHLLQGAGKGVHPVQDGMVTVFGAFFVVFADGGGDEVGLPLLIGRLVVQHLLSPAVLGPQGLALALAVAADDGIGSIQNGAGAAVVLFQADDLGLAELLLKREDVFDGGAPELVDALVVIADHTKIAMGSGQQADQQILGVVGILVLIHHDVPVAALVLLQHLRELLEQPDRQQDDVIKIQGVGVFQHLLVAAVNPGCHLQGKVIPRRLAQPFRGEHFILGAADIAQQGLGREVFIADVELGHGVFDDPDGIIGIVDGEISVVAQGLYLRAKDAGAGRVKGGGVHILATGAQHARQARA